MIIFLKSSYRIILFFFLGVGPCLAQSPSLEIDEIRIYRIGWFNHYIVDIPCETIKCSGGISVTVEKNKQNIEKILSLLSDTNSLTLSNVQQNSDYRILIEFLWNKVLIQTLCLSKMELITFNNKVYRYNKDVEDFLFYNKLK